MTGTTGGSAFSVRPTRVRFDPNDLARGEPQYHLAMFDDADGPVREDQVVTIVKVSEDNDEPDLIGTARVAKIDTEFELIYLEIHRDSFRKDTGRSSMWLQTPPQRWFPTPSGSSGGAGVQRYHIEMPPVAV